MTEGLRDTGRPIGFAEDLLREAIEGLFYGERSGARAGQSPFAALAIVGVYHVLDQRTGEHGLRPAGVLLANNDFPEARQGLLAKLREMVADLENIETSSKQVPT